jgi:hypothetical protein
VNGFEQIDAMIASLKSLNELPESAADDVAHVVEAELRRTIAAGTTPDGKPWKLTLDGQRPLQHAGGALKVAAVGGTVYVRIAGPDARHHLGHGRGGVVREVIPTGDIPAPMVESIRRVLMKHFERHMRGEHGV